VWLEGLGRLGKVNDLVGCGTRDLTACSTVPQPATLPRAQGLFCTIATNTEHDMTSDTTSVIRRQRLNLPRRTKNPELASFRPFHYSVPSRVRICGEVAVARSLSHYRFGNCFGPLAVSSMRGRGRGRGGGS
jgi:hypothetical protein